MIIEIKKTDYPILMDIWGSAVLNTHDFLKQEDFLYYKEHLPAYFQYVALYGCEQDGRLVGFIGVAENNIEMLFIHVNEQNIQAVGFYQHMGFSVITRSDLDAEGKAYPILHMQR